MRRILLGIHIHSEPQQLLATLESVRTHTRTPYDLIVLPDGPDGPTRSVLVSLSNVAQLGTEEPRGVPACFNRLVSAREAEIFVLLESDSRVGPDWLELLLAGLESQPQNGLAGMPRRSFQTEPEIWPTSPVRSRSGPTVWEPLPNVGTTLQLRRFLSRRALQGGRDRWFGRRELRSRTLPGDGLRQTSDATRTSFAARDCGRKVRLPPALPRRCLSQLCPGPAHSN
jgi:hypothetical protein